MKTTLCWHLTMLAARAAKGNRAEKAEQDQPEGEARKQTRRHFGATGGEATAELEETAARAGLVVEEARGARAA